MKAALVGGGGFIGHHTALEMASRGWQPTIMDSFQINNLHSLEPGPSFDRSMIQERIRLLNAASVPIIQLDARYYDLLSQNISWVKPDIILHFAAVSHIDRGNKNPRTTLDHSLRTLENSLDTARALGIPLVYFSSSTVYGDFAAEVLDETAPCDPKGIYGSMKLCGEILTNAYRDTYGLPTTIIRPCALYGPRCISRRVTQVFVENALLGKPIIVKGGEQKIDFTYIDDLVDGIMRVCDMGVRGETFNITGGQGESMAHMVEVIHELAPFNSVNFTAKDPERPERGTMSVAKAERLLGYRPSHKLETGMAKYIEWYRDFLDRNKSEERTSPS